MRIVIAEDSVLLREGLTRLLADAGEEIVAAVGDAETAEAVVAEALTNVARHADATQAVVTVRTDEAANTLHVSVFDDGRGGAHIDTDEDSTGLRGLAERVRAARGTFTVSSPVTGPTIVTAVLPCAS